MNADFTAARWLLASMLGVLASCGGGTDGTGATPPPASGPVTSSGAMTKGSVILNGLHFDDSRATVLDDRGRGAAQLADGMVVRLRGRSDDGTTGQADRIKVENEVRGAIVAIDPLASPQRFTVAGLNVLVDATTVFADVAGFADLAVGNRVEVHGLRDALGNLRATRVERIGAGVGADELRGAVSALDTANHQFVLNGTVTVNYTGASFLPAGATEAALGNDKLVEVRGAFAGGVFTATQVAVEQLQDAEFRGNNFEKQEVEGFVTGFVAHPGSFLVDGRAVRTTGATTFERGAADDLADNVRVEVDGTIDAGGVLVVTRVKFEEERLRLHGLATSVDAGARTLVVLGQTVQADDLTRIDARASGGNSGSLADITAGVDCVEVRGHIGVTGLVAEEIKEPSGCGDDIVQAHATGKNEATLTLTFFGSLQAALGGSGVQFRDAAGQPVSPAQFFAAVVPAGAGNAGTLVKVRGAFSAGVITAQEAEIEN